MTGAAEMGQRPGTIQWIPEESIDGVSALTHNLHRSMLADDLTLERNCTVTLLGIQPGSNEVSGEISVEVSQAIQEMLDELQSAA